MPRSGMDIIAVKEWGMGEEEPIAKEIVRQKHAIHIAIQIRKKAHQLREPYIVERIVLTLQNIIMFAASIS